MWNLNFLHNFLGTILKESLQKWVHDSSAVIIHMITGIEQAESSIQFSGFVKNSAPNNTWVYGEQKS